MLLLVKRINPKLSTNSASCECQHYIQSQLYTYHYSFVKRVRHQKLLLIIDNTVYGRNIVKTSFDDYQVLNVDKTWHSYKTHYNDKKHKQILRRSLEELTVVLLS